MKKERVIFRKWNEGWGVVALFPDISAGTDCRGFPLVTSYEHIGQHGGADLERVMHHTTEATPAEYAELKAELIQRGYKL